jgi:hypothetical protein
MIFKINHYFAERVHRIDFQAETDYIYCKAETKFYFWAKLVIYMFTKHGALFEF